MIYCCGLYVRQWRPVVSGKVGRNDRIFFLLYANCILQMVIDLNLTLFVETLSYNSCKAATFTVPNIENIVEYIQWSFIVFFFFLTYKVSVFTQVKYPHQPIPFNTQVSFASEFEAGFHRNFCSTNFFLISLKLVSISMQKKCLQKNA